MSKRGKHTTKTMEGVEAEGSGGTGKSARLVLDLGATEAETKAGKKIGAGRVGSPWFTLLQRAQEGKILS